MTDLTAANAVFTLAVTGLFPAPLQLQGFAADDIFSIDPIAASETIMGVDGKLSGGYINVEVTQNVTLQADSASMFIFDQWYLTQKFAQKIYTANGIVILPGLSTKWTLTKGFLKTYPPVPDVKRLVRERKFAITWESVVPASF